MATRKSTAPQKTRRGRAPKGFEKMMVRVEPAQAEAVREEAYRRARAKGSVLVDASEVVREALDLWMKARGL